MPDDLKKMVVSGGLKLKKGNVFKKKKKEVDLSKVDLTIKREETTKKATKTPAEIAFEERQAKNAFTRLSKKAALSHREKVEQFNEKMSTLTEFNDIPKISWTK